MKNCFILSRSRNEVLPRGYWFFFAFVLLGKILHGDRRRNMVLRGVRRDTEGELEGDRREEDMRLIESARGLIELGHYSSLDRAWDNKVRVNVIRVENRLAAADSASTAGHAPLCHGTFFAPHGRHMCLLCMPSVIWLLTGAELPLFPLLLLSVWVNGDVCLQPRLMHWVRFIFC